MYYYIIDPGKLAQKQFERVQNELYSSLSEYRVSGENARVSPLRPVSTLVDVALARGAKTIVAVGNDDTLHEVINALQNQDVVIGFIPLVPTELSEILGLSSINYACKHIAFRRIALMDVGMINKNIFLSKLTFGYNPEDSASSSWVWGLKNFSKISNQPVLDINLSSDSSFQAHIKATAGMIINARKNASEILHPDPADGLFDVLLLPQLSKLTVFKNRKHLITGVYEKLPACSVINSQKIEISNPEGMPLRIGNRVVAKTPAVIQVIPKAIKIIVGRERQF
jgi:diacylglycerol kinase family enzyme